MKKLRVLPHVINSINRKVSLLLMTLYVLGLCDNRKSLITIITIIVPYMHEIYQNTTENYKLAIYSVIHYNTIMVNV